MAATFMWPKVMLNRKDIGLGNPKQNLLDLVLPLDEYIHRSLWPK